MVFLNEKREYHSHRERYSQWVDGMDRIVKMLQLDGPRAAKGADKSARAPD